MSNQMDDLRQRLDSIKQRRKISSRVRLFKFQPFSRRQKQILTWWLPGSPVRNHDGIIADGAIRSGKTVCMSLSFVFWAMDTFDGQNFIMAGKTISSFQRNVLTNLKIMLRSRGYRFVHHLSGETPNMLEVARNGVTNYFYIFGGKDEGSQDLVQGITAAGAFFDEVALMPESFVNQATGRCSVDGSKYWFNCNPDGPYHWFKVGWIDRSTGYLGKAEVERLKKEAAEKKQDIEFKRLLYVHFTMDDNLSLSSEIKARYQSWYAGMFFKRYILGLWAMAEGIIYDMFDAARHVIRLANVEEQLIQGNRYVSCDYGTQNALAFLLWNKGTDGVWYCTREYYYSGRDTGKQKADSDYADDFEKWLDGTRIKAVIIDPSAASFAVELNHRGYQTIKADNNVADGIRLVATLLNTGKIAFAECCTNTIKEFASYVWDQKATDRGVDEPLKQHDHAMDAVRYFCYTILFNRVARIKKKSSYGFH